MNTEDFENQLRRVPMREVPAEWRAEMLGKTRDQGARRSAEKRNAQSWWRDLLWPSPLAWGALAGVWVAIVVMAGVDQRGTRAHLGQQAGTAAPPDTMITRLALERSLAGNKGLF